jgi:hypothetical protein
MQISSYAMWVPVTQPVNEAAVWVACSKYKQIWNWNYEIWSKIPLAPIKKICLHLRHHARVITPLFWHSDFHIKSVKLSLCLPSALDGGEWSASRSAALLPRKGLLVATGYETGWAPQPVWTIWRSVKIFFPCQKSNLRCPVIPTELSLQTPNFHVHELWVHGRTSARQEILQLLRNRKVLGIIKDKKYW